MKTKKILWPWAERQIKGKKKTSGQPVFGSANMVQDNTGNEVFDNTEIPYDSRPIEISEWFHTFMCMNILPEKTGPPARTQQNAGLCKSLSLL